MRILRTVEVSSPHLGQLCFGRILVSKNKRKLGLGEKVMSEALSYSEDNYPGELVEMSAQAYLVSFYKKFKFKVVGKEYLEDGIPHVKMIKN